MIELAAVIEGDALAGNWLAAWSWPMVPLVSLSLALAVYMRGWLAARQTRRAQLPAWRACCFAGGIAALWIALASPIDALDDYLLTVHMIQHFILMSVAPPLIVLGTPTVPLLRGLPRVVVRRVIGPLLQASWVRGLIRFGGHPMTAWLAMNE